MFLWRRRKASIKRRQIDNGDDDIWPDENYTGLWEVYWPNLKVKFRANFVNGKEEGEYLCFWDNGNLAQRGLKVNGDCVGIWTDYSYEGNKSLEGLYVGGKQQGVWRSFWDNGIVMKEKEFVDGMEHGYARHFSDDGELIYEGEFRNGEPFNGICETPDFDRHPYYVKIGEYIEGEMVRELPFEFRLGLVESDEEKLH